MKSYYWLSLVLSSLLLFSCTKKEELTKKTLSSLYSFKEIEYNFPNETDKPEKKTFKKKYDEILRELNDIKTSKAKNTLDLLKNHFKQLIFDKNDTIDIDAKHDKIQNLIDSYKKKEDVINEEGRMTTNFMSSIENADNILYQVLKQTELGNNIVTFKFYSFYLLLTIVTLLYLSKLKAIRKFLVKNNNTSSDNSARQENTDKVSKESEVELSKIKTILDNLEKSIRKEKSDLEKKIGVIENEFDQRISKLEEEQNSKSETGNNSIELKVLPTPFPTNQKNEEKNVVKYAKSIDRENGFSDEYLVEKPSIGTIFRIEIISNDKAEFYINENYPSEQKAIAAAHNYLLKHCLYLEGVPKLEKRIKTDTPGKLVKRTGFWEIVSKAKIKFV